MKNYVEPKLEVIDLQKEDVITTSGSFSSLFKDSGSYSSDRGMTLTSYRID